MSKNKLDLRMKETQENLSKMCKGLKTLTDCGIKRDLIVLMLKDMTNVNKSDIIAILEALPKMEQRYLK